MPLRLLAAVALLQPLFLIALVALDFVAPPVARLTHLQVQAPIVTDDTSECGAESIGLEPGASPLRHAIIAARPIGKTVSMTTCEALHRVATGDTSDIIWYPLDRYWHGYRIVIDPLTALVSWRSAQWFMLVLLGLALVYFARGSADLVGWTATVALLVPTLILTDFRWLWLQAQSSVATCFIFAGAGWFARRARGESDLLVPSIVMGSVFNYLDLLTNPPWQPMLLAFFALAAGRGLKAAVAVLACWTAGYGLTWATKWALAVSYGGDWNYIWETILFRIDGSVEQVVDHRPFASSAKIIIQLARYAGYWWIAIAALIAWLMMTAPRPDYRRWALLASPALVPFIWFEVLRNHTQIHAWFVFRPAATSLGVLLAAWPLSSRAPKARYGHCSARRSVNEGTPRNS